MLKTYKPITPGQRGKRTLIRGVSAKSPEKALTKPLKGAVGRNKGRISSRNRQQGTKKKYRVVDFKRDKVNVPAKVVSIEHDPNRGPNVALLHYADGEKRYILAPEDLKPGMTVVSGDQVEIQAGNCMPLKNIPLGMPIHNIELNPGRGGQMVRGAGNSALILAKEGKYVNVRLPSGEVKQFLDSCVATIGTLGNADLRHENVGKAGIKRYQGRRPHTRGVAYSSPREHPHGGSYKTSGVGMSSPKSPWGWKTRGKKTRRRKSTDKYVVKSRGKRR